MNEGDREVLNGSASSDPDDGVNTYTWTQVSGPAWSLLKAGDAQATFTAPTVRIGCTVLVFQLAYLRRSSPEIIANRVRLL